MINENVAYAKSILSKKGIGVDSTEYADYLKIRDICGTNNGYVGILTKIRFIDNVTDMDEISSIFDILKNSKIDIAKMNKMSYDDILEIFYDELSSDNTKNEDYELIFKDSEYLYYEVFTYKGILKIGSPSWCLKTKANWDKYMSTYGRQFVVINCKYKNKIISPDDNYLNNYVSNKGYIRYGISARKNTDSTISWIANDDNNTKCNFNPGKYTFYGVMNTIVNLLSGIKLSYYDSFRGCQKYLDSKHIHKVINKDSFFERLDYDSYGDKLRPYQKLPHQFDNIYVAFSITYSGPFAMMLYSKYEIVLQYPALIKDVSYTTLSDYSMGIIESELLNSDYIISYGLKLKLGKITMGEIQKNDKFICKIDKWLVFHHNENYYLILNTELESYQIPTYSLDKFNYDMVDPLYWYLNKKTKTPYNTKKSYDFHDIVRNEIDRIEKEQKDGGKGIKGFFDFLK